MCGDMSAVNGGARVSVCVLGFGRSGTSLTMRLLHLLGVDIGPQEDLLAPGEADNPRGYWEPGWMVGLNDEILAKLGTVWWRPLPVASGWERSRDFDELRERASGLLRRGSSPGTVAIAPLERAGADSSLAGRADRSTRPCSWRRWAFQPRLVECLGWRGAADRVDASGAAPCSWRG